MSKIENPVVLIHKRDNNDSYAVAITSGSQNYHDAVLMASMEPDMVGDDVDTWSKNRLLHGGGDRAAARKTETGGRKTSSLTGCC
ncbi:Uncharacterised protein [Raoultella planticola]|nr:Uncharacterised protein [Raoultella planticola]